MPLKSPAVCMQTSEVDLLRNTIAKIFYNDPRAKYIIPDARTRRAVLSWFASAILPACRTWGELYAIVKAEAGALWIRPGSEWTIGRALKMKMTSSLFKLDPSSIKRLINFIRYVESVQGSLTNKLDWRLIALVTGPSVPAMVSRIALIDPILAAADSELRSCYVEIFDENDLAFYEQRGFRIGGAGQIPNGGPTFWTLNRPPRTTVLKSTNLPLAAPLGVSPKAHRATQSRLGPFS